MLDAHVASAWEIENLMSGAPNDIFGRWMHSFEEDEGDLTVYRPASYDFPRARGRAGIEIHPDGTFVELAIGRGDANEAVPGRWQMVGPDRLRTTGGEAMRPPRTLEIVESGPDILKVRASPRR